MKKLVQASLLILAVTSFLLICPPAWSLDAPTIAATAYGPNHIILTWPAVSSPGWGYRVEIIYVSTTNPDGADTRYSDWTELSWRNGLSYLPYWVTDQGGTERPYTDPTTASSGWGANAQCNIYGLKYGTTYNFRVRTWGKTDAAVAVYGSYSVTASATTLTPATIRYVDRAATGTNSGTSWANAWTNIYRANGVASGTLVQIKGGNYASDYVAPTVAGTAGTGRTVFQGYPGDTVTITSNGSGRAQVIAQNSNFVVIDGINITSAATSTSDPPVSISASRTVFANCQFQGLIDATQYALIWSNGAYTYNLIHNCYLHDNGANGGEGELVTFFGAGCDRNTVQFSRLSRGTHGSGSNSEQASYNRWLNNLQDLGGELVVAVSRGTGTSCRYSLAEGNIITTTGTVTLDYKPGIQISGSYNTVRRNIIYDGYAGGSGGVNSAGIEISNLSAKGASYNLIYNNTVVHNGGAGIQDWGGTSNTVKNNIFYDNAVGTTEACPNLEILTDAAAGGANVISRNLILDVTPGGVENPGAQIICRAYGSCDTVAYANSHYADIIGNYDNYPPRFIDYVGRDLHLKSTSGLINLGDVVTDNTWGTITYKGPAPDLGAFEYMAPDAPGGPAAPQNLRILE